MWGSTAPGILPGLMSGVETHTGDEPILVNATYNKGRASRLHVAMHSLNDDLGSQVRSGTLNRDTPRWRAWKRWIEGYGKWFGSVPTGATSYGLTGWGTGGVAAMLDSYEAEMIDWRNWYGRNFRVSPSGQYNPRGSATAPPGAGLPERVPSWLWAGLGIAGLFAAASLVKGLKA